MKEDGGPAFPLAHEMPSGKDAPPEFVHIIRVESGMSLRDYFAAAALTQRGKEWGEDGYGYADIARYCYSQADALLAERKK